MDAPETAELPRDLAFVDLETTGGNAAHHRITEVGIIRMRDGVVVEEWSSLVNPDRPIPPHIQAFTGISNEMVAGAPRFRDLAPEVLRRLHGPSEAERPVFVAHNARFDHSFLRAEFRRLGLPFCVRVLCTVKLSRRLYPQFPRHNLDALMERHGLSCAARHRALGDARVLGDLWTALGLDVPAPRLAGVVRQLLNAPRLPAHLPPELADELPDGSGVYRFFDEHDVLLYVGRSRTVRAQVLKHFAQDAERGPATPGLVERVRRIDWVETAGELGALLQERAWLDACRPAYNPRAKADAGFTLQIEQASAVRMLPLAELEPSRLESCFGVFHTAKDARKAALEIARAHGLCLKVMGLEESEGSCLARQLGRCKGACVGAEAAILHDLRLRTAFSSLKLKSWPFPGRVAVREGRGEYLVLDRWSYLGTARSDEELEELASRPAPSGFDAGVYRILARHLGRTPRLDWRGLDARP